MYIVQRVVLRSGLFVLLLFPPVPVLALAYFDELSTLKLHLS